MYETEDDAETCEYCGRDVAYHYGLCDAQRKATSDGAVQASTWYAEAR